MGELDGKVALVTGASSGIGYAIAERFGAEGARVAVNYHGDDQTARDLAERLSAAGAPAVPIQGDVSVSADVRAMVERAAAELGPVSVLVNNAGIESKAPFLEVDEEDWDRVLAVNLKGPFLCAQACAALMREHGGGTIVNVSSIHEDLPFADQAPYAAAKGGLRMLMRNLAVELAPFGIRVNNVAPGPIATPVNEDDLSNPETLQVLRHTVPLRRWGEPEEVAEVALFLASERSAYVTGSTYYVDGGMLRHTEPV